MHLTWLVIINIALSSMFGVICRSALELYPRLSKEKEKESNKRAIIRPERINRAALIVSSDGFSGNGGNNERSMCNSKLSKAEFLEHLKSLRLRFFSPREIARIHGIPDSYSFPEVLSEKQLYKLLGNGLNVSVVRLLIEKVLLE